MARILLGVTGGIAAYKAVELVRLATKAGHSVRVVQTPASRQFVGAATFEAVSGAPVLVDQFESDPARGAFPGDPVSAAHMPISHLALAERADVLVIAPASADTLAKLAHGHADNLLTTSALACEAPLVLAPAMNDRMWAHPATAANVSTLRLRGATIVGPGVGSPASRGEWGAGRLAEPQELLAAIEATAGRDPDHSTSSLAGLNVLVTAGGTRERIDSVRYIGNRSSGRMGIELAREALSRGADVTVVAANVSLDAPSGANWIEVESAAELEATTREHFAAADVLLMAAAVADFKPRGIEPGKIDKSAAGSAGLELELEPTTDVLAALSQTRHAGQTLVGFAAEHGPAGVERARDKLERKGLDAIVVNDISRDDIGFDGDQNEVSILGVGRDRLISRTSKARIAAGVIDAVADLRSARSEVG